MYRDLKVGIPVFLRLFAGLLSTLAEIRGVYDRDRKGPANIKMYFLVFCART